MKEHKIRYLTSHTSALLFCGRELVDMQRVPETGIATVPKHKELDVCKACLRAEAKQKKLEAAR